MFPLRRTRLRCDGVLSSFTTAELLFFCSRYKFVVINVTGDVLWDLLLFALSPFAHSQNLTAMSGLMVWTSSRMFCLSGHIHKNWWSTFIGGSEQVQNHESGLLFFGVRLLVNWALLLGVFLGPFSSSSSLSVEHYISTTLFHRSSANQMCQKFYLNWVTGWEGGKKIKFFFATRAAL